MIRRFIDKADQSIRDEIEQLIAGKSFLKNIRQELTYRELDKKFCAAFPDGYARVIGAMLHEYLWDSISVRDTAVRKNMKENFYHSMVLGLLQSRSNWLIRSNAKLGERLR